MGAREKVPRVPLCDYYTCDPDGESYDAPSVAAALDAWEQEWGPHGAWDDVLVFGFNGTPDGDHALVGHFFGRPAHGLTYQPGTV